MLGLKLIFFRSSIHTNWILFSILLDHAFALFRSELAVFRSVSNDFPTSAAFLDLSRSILGLKHVFFRSSIHTTWMLFSILFDHAFA